MPRPENLPRFGGARDLAAGAPRAGGDRLDQLPVRGHLGAISQIERILQPGAQVTAIGRAEIWPLHQRCADLGGHLRTGLEDSFYLADGTKVTSNGQLIEAIAACARRAGREIASPAEAREIFGTRH